MYSKNILRILKIKKINIGDRIEVISKNRKIQGILMPRPDISDSDCLIIKLNDGYNIGVGIKSIDNITKASDR